MPNYNRTVTSTQVDNNTRVVDMIVSQTYKNGWTQIEGGDNHLKWVNTKHYGNNVFDSGRIYEYRSGETHYFPLSCSSDDPKGLAFHYQTSGCGSYRQIRSNAWQKLPSLARPKKARRRRNHPNRQPHQAPLTPSV